MSVMNMLSDEPAPAPPAPAPPSPEKIAPAPLAPTSSAAPAHIKIESAPSNTEHDTTITNGLHSHERRSKHERDHPPEPASVVPVAMGPPGLTVRATEEAFAGIIEQADTSDVDEPGFEPMKDQWIKRSMKRVAEMEAREGDKRKVSR